MFPSIICVFWISHEQLTILSTIGSWNFFLWSKKLNFGERKRWYRANSGECRICVDNNGAVGTVSFPLHVRKNEHSPLCPSSGSVLQFVVLLGEFVMHSFIKVKTQLFLYSEASSSAFLSAFIVSYTLTANPHILYKQLPSVRIIMAYHSSTLPFWDSNKLV